MKSRLHMCFGFDFMHFQGKAIVVEDVYFVA